MALSPPVRRERRRRHAFFIASTLGGAATGLLLFALSGLGQPLPTVAAALLIAAVGAAGVLDATGVVLVPKPQAGRQIPRTAFDTGGMRGVVRFGFALGSGMRTYVTANPPYVMAAVLLLGEPTIGISLATGAAFGAGRGWLPFSRAAAADSAAWDAATGWWAGRAQVPTIIVVTAIAIMFIVR